MFDGLSFFADHGIEYETTGKNISSKDDWVGLNCPKCGDHSYHMGFNVNSGAFSCWRCGRVSILEAIKLLTNTNWNKAKKILKEYGDFDTQHIYQKAPRERDIDVVLPNTTMDTLKKRHKDYLKDRNFDPDYLYDVWGIRGTKKYGNFHNRIIAPIYHNNKLCSYMGRDITGEQELRYKACPKDLERRDFKFCLYGLDFAVGKSVLVLEGFTDVWRFGFGAVGLFGITYTKVQVLLLVRNFENIFIMLDETELQAQEQAMKLALEIQALGKYSEVVQAGVDHDPALFSKKDADYIMQELLIR